MKFSSQEEYGLRCLLRLGMRYPSVGAGPSATALPPHPMGGGAPGRGPHEPLLGARPADGAAPGSLTIAEISRQEGLSAAYVAKLMRVLRTGKLVTSARGAAGGYMLARPPERISVGAALAVLGGRLYEPQFCKQHTGEERVCTHSVDCSLRSLWRSLQVVLDQVLDKTSLRDLLCNEIEMTSWIGHLVAVTGLAAHASEN